MMRQSGRQRAGFTLIELLVVISIIAVLIGLTLAAVMQVLGLGPKADTTSRITATSNAIGTFKSERGVPYIPGGCVDDSPTVIVPGNLVPQPNPKYGSVIGPFRLRNVYPQPGAVPNFPLTEPDANSFEARYIKRVFPNADIDGTLSPSPPNNDPLLALALGSPPTVNANFRADLDANQTLLFFLNGLADQDPNAKENFAFRGFSKNPQRPFEPFIDPSNPTKKASDRTKPYLDFSNKHYLAPVNTAFNQNAASPNLVNPNYPWMVDGWRRPFAYFAAFNGKATKVPVPTATVPNPPTAFDGLNNQFSVTAVANIKAAMGVPKAYINGTRYELESGFQIVSAGKDGIFGTSGDWNNVDKSGQDDRANFSTANLGAGPTK